MKLASIEKIINIIPIEGADKIELAQVLGWQTVVKRGEFKIGDLIVWHNPDTIVDETNPVYEFLRKSNFRLKTCKFRGKFSQGLALPANNETFKHLDAEGLDIFEGSDVSSAIRIQKYEKPVAACLAGTVKGNFPTELLAKTDEQLLKSNPDVIKEFAGLECYATLKLDGSSATFIYNNDTLRVCSRNLELEETEDNSLWKLARKYNLKEQMGDFGGKNFALQTECCGGKIQGNPLGLNEVDFYCFNLVALESQDRYRNYDQLLEFVNAMKLKIVPLVWKGTFPVDNAIQFFQDLANKVTYPSGKPGEGIVVRPYNEQYSQVLGGRLSIKIINQNYND